MYVMLASSQPIVANFHSRQLARCEAKSPPIIPGMATSSTPPLSKAARQETVSLTVRLQSPEIQTMYSLNMPVSAIRTKVRQEFERHRFVNQLSVVDVLLFQSHSEFQVRRLCNSYKG